MQSLQSFFKTIQESELPFVIYRKPGEREVRAYFQKDRSLHLLKEYTEEGFVFAPFDTQKPSILFPISQLEKVLIDTTEREEMPLDTPDVQLGSERQSHLQLVQKGINAIERGEMKKVVLSRKQNIKLKNKNPFIATSRLLSQYPTAFVYCWYHPTIGLWLGATPETLLSIKNRKLETMALAGTQPYQGSMDLSWGEKEKQEQEVVTQAIIKALSPLLAQGLDVKGPVSSRAGSLVHLKTSITAMVNPLETSLKDIIQALHPTPAICGFPRDQAYNFISSNEGYDRAFYTGYLGELNMVETVSRSKTRRNTENQAYQAIKRSTHLFVNLRCMQWENKLASMYVGGGITAGSIPEQEWEETVNKLQTMLTIL